MREGREGGREGEGRMGGRREGSRGNVFWQEHLKKEVQYMWWKVPCGLPTYHSFTSVA